MKPQQQPQPNPPRVYSQELVDRQRDTIKVLVELVDEARQPLNNTRYHDIYLHCVQVLNELEERGRI